MEGDDVLYDNEDAGKLFRPFHLISQLEAPDADLHQQLFVQLPVAVLILKGDHFIIEAANNINLAIWGKGQNMIGKPLPEVMPGFAAPDQLQLLKNVYTTGQPFYFNELPVSLIKNGKAQTGYYTIEYQPWRNDTGAIAGIIATGFDVTDYVTARQQLEETEQQFRDVITKAPVSIAIYRGHNMVFEFANDDYLQRVDKTYDELIGKPFFEVLPELAGQGLEEIYNEVCTTGKPYHAKAFSAYFTRYGKSGRYYSNFVYYPMHNANKEVDGAMVILNDISDLIHSTKVIEESERQLRNLVMQSPVAMGILQGKDLVIDMANEALLQICERTSNVIGKKSRDVFPEFENQPFPQWLMHVYRTGETINQSEALAYYRNAGGKLVEKYVQLRFAPLLEAPQVVSGVIVTVNDVTAQVKARKQVEENEHYFRKMADNVPAIIFLWRSDGYCIYKNKRWYEYTGVNQEAGQGFSWFNYVDINSRPEVQQTLFDAIKNKTSLKVEFQLRGKNGKYRWFEKAVVPRYDDNGNIEGYIGTMTDIHERKLAEEQLRDAEERLRLAAEANGMATFDMDMQTSNTLISTRLLDIFGCSNVEVPDMTMPRSKLFEKLHPDDVVIAEHAMQRAYQNGSYSYEARIVWPDKSIHWIKVEGRIFYSRSNKPMRMIGMVEDITRRKQLEQHKDDFMGIVSHELKTPVTTLKVYTQLLQDQFESTSNAGLSNMLQKMDSQINKLALLIKDLLDTARIDTGTLQVDCQLFDVNKVLNEVADELSVTSTTHRIIKQNNVSFMVMGDAARTSQVIFNLLTNAIKYSPNAREVVINTQQKGRYVWCSVQDFGMGIAPDNLANVFEKYFRINKKPLGTYPGLGLGLFISAQIIRLQGGDIWAESEEGKGSTFWFSLPLADVGSE